jgi:hypothetical protein
MNYEVLRDWFQQSHERLMFSLILICIGVLSSVYWIFFALARVGFFAAKLEVKLTTLMVLAVVIGSAVAGSQYDRTREAFGLSLAISVGAVWALYYVLQWLKWMNS